jgi:DNA-binding response OmpR family regulator
MAFRILLVEDDPNDAELARACLAEALASGAEISHVASLAAALRALEVAPHDLVVLDLDLPDSSGFVTLERLAAAASLPVIVVSGNPHPALVAEARKRGARDVLKKGELEAGLLARIVRRGARPDEAQPGA